MNPNLKPFARKVERVEVEGLVFMVKGVPTALDLASIRDDPDFSYKLLVMCVFMEDGSPAFTEADIPDMKAETGLFSFGRLFVAANKVNGLDIGAQEKNSAAVPSGEPS